MNEEMPIMKELEPCTYYWWACGKTKTEPFCGGSHTETDSQPVEFKIELKKQVALCNCQRTKEPAFCDDAHPELKRKAA